MDRVRTTSRNFGKTSLKTRL